MTRGKRRCTLACAALLLVSCAGTPGPVSPPPDVTFPVDFAAITRFTEAYRVMRYEPDAQVRATVGAAYDTFELVDLPATRNRYMIGTLDAARRQEIWIRGTANFKNAIYDLEYRKHPNAELGINLHVGFERMAQAVHDDILPRLHPGYSLVIYGHSLGAAEAVILAMMLDVEGWRIEKVYASGQPRVTDAAGERKFDHLPILRIINFDDPVPYLPPRDLPSAADPYVHIGPAVILLDGPYYALITEDEGNEVLAGNYWATLKVEGPVEPVQDHLTPAYLALLRPKLTHAVQVPYADRAKYAVPHSVASH